MDTMCSNWVQYDVAAKLQQVTVSLNRYRLEPPPKQMSDPFVKGN